MESHQHSARERHWRENVGTFLIATTCLLTGYFAIAFVLDPYDSGRSTLFSAGAVRPQGPRTAAAIRGRDPVFEGAIFGNSHIQLVEPARLSEATGIRFVQLSVMATGPAEQFALLDWFLRHHRDPRALIFAPDDYWCTDDPALPTEKPFPFWLFARSGLDYLGGLLRWSVLEEIPARIGWLISRERDMATRDGWLDYEEEYLSRGYSEHDAHGKAAREVVPPDGPDRGRAGPNYPAARRFGDIAARLPASIPVLLVFPPVYATALPRPGSAREKADSACKAAMVAAVGRHPLSAVVDWRRDRPELHDPKHFFDQTHYRHSLARLLGADIAQALHSLAERSGKPASP